MDPPQETTNQTINEEKIQEQPGVLKLLMIRLSNLFIAPLHVVRHWSQELKVSRLVFVTVLILVILLSTLITFFSESNPMNILFVLQFVTFSLCYVLCRRLNITPYVDSERPQSSLKLSAILLQLGIVMFVTSIQFIPVSDVSFVFSVFHLLELGLDNIKEYVKGKKLMPYKSDSASGSGKPTAKTTIASFLVFLGTLIFWLSLGERFSGPLYIKKTLLEALVGVGLSALSFICCYSSWRLLSQNVLRPRHSQANIVSVGIVLSVMLAVSTPAFFAI